MGRYIQATGQLNVRSGPGLHYSELGMLKNGATAAIWASIPRTSAA